MIVAYLLLATTVAGVGSVLLASAVSLWGRFGRSSEEKLLSFAAGCLLATAFLHVLPAALESRVAPRPVFGILLAGLVFFFLIDKLELWQRGTAPDHPDDPSPLKEFVPKREAGNAPGAGAWALLAGDSLHAMGDGILLAAAFAADTGVGLVTALAVLAHEVPRHAGELVVLSATSRSRTAALVKLCVAGALTPAGAMAGWWLLEATTEYVPYLLVLASSSLIYVALADLVPQLQSRLSPAATLAQVLRLCAGVAVVAAAASLLHRH